MLGGLGPPKPPVFVRVFIPRQPQAAFALNPTSQLVIGYPWLAFLNQVLKNLKSQTLKMRILLYENNQKHRKIVFAYVSEHCASFGAKN